MYIKLILANTELFSLKTLSRNTPKQKTDIHINSEIKQKCCRRVSCGSIFVFGSDSHPCYKTAFEKKCSSEYGLVEQGRSRMDTPPKLRFRLQMPFLYHPTGHVPVHFENNRVQLLQWLLPLYSMRKQSVYDSDWNFSYHPEPEESGHVMVTDFALEIDLSSH